MLDWSDQDYLLYQGLNEKIKNRMIDLESLKTNLLAL